MPGAKLFQLQSKANSFAIRTRDFFTHKLAAISGYQHRRQVSLGQDGIEGMENDRFTEQRVKGLG